MRKFIMYFGVLALLILALNSCAFFQFQPRGDSEYRMHPLGLKIYNMSGSEIPEQEWKDIFRVTNFAKRTFEKCAAPVNPDSVKELFLRFIIIIPPKDIFILMENVGGFIDLRSVFVRRDQVFDSTLRHEWIHLYHAISFEKPLAIIFHFLEPRFEKCRYVSDDSDY